MLATWADEGILAAAHGLGDEQQGGEEDDEDDVEDPDGGAVEAPVARRHAVDVGLAICLLLDGR